MSNFLVAVNCVTPVFLMLAVGYLIRVSRLVPESVISGLIRICFYALIPLLMFDSVYTADFGASFAPKMLLYLIVGTIGMYLLSSLILRYAIPDHRSRAILIQTTCRANIGAIGIALAQNMMDRTGVAMMAMAVAVMIPLFNVLGVMAFETCRGGKVSMRSAAKNVATNPLILGALAGGLFLLLGIRLPQSVVGAISSMGKASTVMTQIALGATLDFSVLRHDSRNLVLGNVLRLAATPALMVGAATALGFRGNELGVILLCTACPIASPVFSMAQVYDSDYELAGQMIVTTSMFCCFTICLWIFLLKQLGLL